MSDTIDGAQETQLYSIELPGGGGPVTFWTGSQIAEWAQKEREFWDWLRKIALRDNEEFVQIKKTLLDNINQLSEHGKKIDVDTNNLDARRRVKESLSQFEKGVLIHSSSRKARIISEIREELGDVAAAGALLAAKNIDFFVSSWKLVEGASRYTLYILEVNKESAKSSVDWIEGRVSEIQNDTNDILEKYKRSFRKFDQERGKVRRAHQAIKKWARQTADDVIRNFNDRVDDKIEVLNNLEQSYNEKLKLHSAVKYWTDKRDGHLREQEKFKKYLLNIVKYGGVSIFIYIMIAFGLSIIFKGQGLVFIAASVLFLTTIGLWVGRVVLKIYLSEHHLAVDSEERATMVLTYLALTKEGQAEIVDRTIVLTTLFRPSSDGVVREDGASDISASAVLAKFLDRRGPM